MSTFPPKSPVYSICPPPSQYTSMLPLANLTHFHQQTHSISIVLPASLKQFHSPTNKRSIYIYTHQYFHLPTKKVEPDIFPPTNPTYCDGTCTVLPSIRRLRMQACTAADSCSASQACSIAYSKQRRSYANTVLS